MHSVCKGEVCCEELVLKNTRLPYFGIKCISEKGKVVGIPVKIFEKFSRKVLGEFKSVYLKKVEYRMEILRKNLIGKLNFFQQKDVFFFKLKKPKIENEQKKDFKNKKVENYDTFFRNEQLKLNETIDQLKLLTLRHIRLDRISLAKSCLRNPKRKKYSLNIEKAIKIEGTNQKVAEINGSFLGRMMYKSVDLRKNNETFALIKTFRH